MIKTTSFAPPRPPRKQRQSQRVSGSSVAETPITTVRPPQSSSSRSNAKILTSVRRSSVPDLPTIPVPAKSAKSKTAQVTAPQEMTLDFDFEVAAPVSRPAKEAETPIVSKTKTAKTKAVASTPPKAAAPPVRSSESKVTAKQAEAVKESIAEPVSEATAPAPKKKAAPKAKRVRVPENLAEQYGAKLSKRVESGITDVPTEDTPKKRLNKAEREARKQLLRPDEGLIERLQRAANLIPAKKVVKPKGWKFECGRCGRTTYFQTPSADICVCGAIAVKD
jgi:hypothetical protein